MRDVSSHMRDIAIAQDDVTYYVVVSCLSVPNGHISFMGHGRHRGEPQALRASRPSGCCIPWAAWHDDDEARRAIRSGRC